MFDAFLSFLSTDDLRVVRQLLMNDLGRGDLRERHLRLMTLDRVDQEIRKRTTDAPVTRQVLGS